jgi:hypothetical protein
LAILPTRHVVAADLLGLYVGGAVGQSRGLKAIDSVGFPVYNGLVTETQSFEGRRTAFSVMLGVRPISLLGAEIDYIDLGKPSGSLWGNPADISMKGEAAFGVLYLPVPIVDVYLKAGVARLESTVNGSVCTPCACDFCRYSFQLNRTNTSGAGGVGTQYKFGAWAVRAEYERFNAAGGNPSLVSLGVTWTFF